MIFRPAPSSSRIDRRSRYRAQDDVAEGIVAGNELSETGNGNHEDRPRLGDHGGHEHHLTREQTELAEEPAWAMLGEHLLVRARRDR